ncbi:hypothetical protein C5E23_12260 [Pectobacterium parmentieri]|nr:hypothetical protein C5E25_12310 [Pectobacterium parmentieri]AYH14890.1 hypothetical protein C5E23_12260 [Pectobacterium parmentieri]AYH23591.1 hypothetical protein C5E21_12270 [Pectobacterium parmentieri]RKO80373.1 hypothetical protein C5E04_13980 [Pectobacterium parmentieri]
MFLLIFGADNSRTYYLPSIYFFNCYKTFFYYLNYFVVPLLLWVFAQLIFIFNIPFFLLTSSYPKNNQSDIIYILHNKKTPR